MWLGRVHGEAPRGEVEGARREGMLGEWWRRPPSFLHADSELADVTPCGQRSVLTKRKYTDTKTRPVEHTQTRDETCSTSSLLPHAMPTSTHSGMGSKNVALIPSRPHAAQSDCCSINCLSKQRHIRRDLHVWARVHRIPCF